MTVETEAERRHYYNAMYATLASLGFVGMWLITLGIGVVLPMVFLLLAAVAAMFARSSFTKRNRLMNGRQR